MERGFWTTSDKNKTRGNEGIQSCGRERVTEEIVRGKWGNEIMDALEKRKGMVLR